MELMPILKGFQSAAQECGMEALAAEMGISAASLYAMLNPYVDEKERKHLRLTRALLICKRSGNYSGLVEFLRQQKYTVTKDDSEPDKKTVHEECLDDVQALSRFQLAIAEGLHPTSTRLIADDLINDLNQTQTLYERNYAQKGMHP